MPCEREGLSFIPLPAETLGGWSENAVKQLKRIGSALAGRTGKDEGEVQRHLLQRLSVLLMKGNSILLINRIPSYPENYLDGDL